MVQRHQLTNACERYEFFSSFNTNIILPRNFSIFFFYIKKQENETPALCKTQTRKIKIYFLKKFRLLSTKSITREYS